MVLTVVVLKCMTCKYTFTYQLFYLVKIHREKSIYSIAVFSTDEELREDVLNPLITLEALQKYVSLKHFLSLPYVE